MDIYKTFLYEVRKLSLVEPFFKIHGDVTPMLRHYIKLLYNVSFTDGSYHTYYGEVKKIVNSFINCWGKTMDEAYKVADKYTHIISRDELLNLMDTTISLNEKKQIDFGRDFLPVQSQFEQDVYKEVEEHYSNFMERLYQLRSDIERLDKQDKVDEFAKKYFPMSLKKKNEVFLYTHTYISLLLTDPVVLDRLRVSLEEIVLRARNNLKCLQEQSTSSINTLLNQLYDKNKEHLTIFRQDTRSSLEIAEVQRSMEILKDKIEDSKHKPISRLVEEYRYWQDRVMEFHQIADALKKLNDEEINIEEQEIIFKKIKCPFRTGPKGECWIETSKTLQENRCAVREMKTNAAKALMTFLSVRGPDRTIYTDNVGPYFVDEYGHQVYFFDYGLKMFHVDCTGQFVEPDENETYYYDDMGRYVIDADGAKLYKIGTCSSSYKLRGDVFEKQTRDCGHSRRQVDGCRMTIKDPNDVTVLPAIQQVNLDEQLEPEMSQYLWASFGHILPLVLRDVAAARPHNPIHYLAHKLLFHKYSRSRSELRAMKDEACKYRAEVFQARKDKSAAAAKTWRARQVQRRRPDGADEDEALAQCARLQPPAGLHYHYA